MFIGAYNNDFGIDVELKGINAKFIDGRERNRNKCFGYCNCHLHKGCLTEEQVREHDCNGKECLYFFNYFDHEKEERRTIRKQSKQEYKNIERMQISCEKVLSGIEDIRILSCRYNHFSSWEVSYVSTFGIDESATRKILETSLGAKIKLIKKEFDFETTASLIFGLS